MSPEAIKLMLTGLAVAGLIIVCLVIGWPILDAIL